MADQQPREKLTIDNFCGIEHIEIEMYPINVLIGPQAGGKSIIAKLFYFFKSFFDEMLQSIRDGLSQKEFEKNYKSRFEKYFAKSSWGQGDFTVKYEIGDTFIQISSSKKKSKLVCNCSHDISELYEEKKQSREELNGQYGNSNFIEILAETKNFDDAFYNSIKSKIYATNVFEPIFVPAGRSFFSNLHARIYTIISNNIVIDPFIVEFGKIYERMVVSLDSPEIKERSFVKSLSLLFEEIIHGKYIRENDKDYIIHKDGRKINVLYTSSGQQEALPLVNLLSSLPFLLKYFMRSSCVFFEEPEAHIFPSAQKKVVEMLALIFNRMGHMQFFITTHSPYILTSFNNLLQAGVMEKEAKPENKEKIYEIVPKEQVLQPGVLQALAIEDGKSTDIYDDEYQMIDTNVIDDVSEELSMQFDKLINL